MALSAGRDSVFARCARRCSRTVESRPPEKAMRQAVALRHGARFSKSLEGKSIAGRSISFPLHKSNVGASLLAKTVQHSTHSLAVIPLSRAGSLPHGYSVLVRSETVAHQTLIPTG